MPFPHELGGTSYVLRRIYMFSVALFVSLSYIGRSISRLLSDIYVYILYSSVSPTGLCNLRFLFGFSFFKGTYPELDRSAFRPSFALFDLLKANSHITFEHTPQ